jgi:hypothetical protein
VGAGSNAVRVPNGFESLVFEDRAHQVVMSAIWQCTSIVDVVGADLALLLGNLLCRVSGLLEPPAKALGDLGQPLVASLARPSKSPICIRFPPP